MTAERRADRFPRKGGPFVLAQADDLLCHRHRRNLNVLKLCPAGDDGGPAPDSRLTDPGRRAWADTAASLAGNRPRTKNTSLVPISQDDGGHTEQMKLAARAPTNQPTATHPESAVPERRSETMGDLA